MCLESIDLESYLKYGLNHAPRWCHLAWLWEKAMATHSSTLAWRIPGTGEPGGLLSMGIYGDMTEAT